MSGWLDLAWHYPAFFNCRYQLSLTGVFPEFSCERKNGDSKSVTSFFSDRHPTPQELDAMPPFIAFISATVWGPNRCRLESHIPKPTDQALSSLRRGGGLAPLPTSAGRRLRVTLH